MEKFFKVKEQWLDSEKSEVLAGITTFMANGVYSHG